MGLNFEHSILVCFLISPNHVVVVVWLLIRLLLLFTIIIIIIREFVFCLFYVVHYYYYSIWFFSFTFAFFKILKACLAMKFSEKRTKMGFPLPLLRALIVSRERVKK